LTLEERLAELNGSKVGFLRPFGDGLLLQEGMVMEGLEKIIVTAMGGHMVLLQSSFPSEIQRAAVNHIDWWEAHFQKVVHWTPNMVAKKRVIWLNFFGTSLHVWEEETFKQLSSMFGEFLDFDDSTISKKRMDVARVKVCTDRLFFIDEHLSIKVVGAAFDLWVVEDGGEEVVRREERSSGGSGGEDRIGNVMGQNSEDDDITPGIGQLGCEVGKPKVKSTSGGMRHEEGQKDNFLGSNQKDPSLGEGDLNGPVSKGHVEGGGVVPSKGQNRVASGGPSSFNVSSYVRGEQRVGEEVEQRREIVSLPVWKVGDSACGDMLVEESGLKEVVGLQCPSVSKPTHNLNAKGGLQFGLSVAAPVFIKKGGLSRKDGEVQRVNKHLYFCSEDSDFSEFSDSVADKVEEAERLLRSKHKQRYHHKKAQDSDIQKDSPSVNALESQHKHIRSGARRRKKAIIRVLVFRGNCRGVSRHKQWFLSQTSYWVMTLSGKRRRKQVKKGGRLGGR